MENNDSRWKVIKSEYVSNRPWLTVRREHVRLANGMEVPEFYVLEYPDWVNVIAITVSGEMVLIRQYRHGIQRTDYELCAGVKEPDESAEDAAKRELLEETGYGKGEWHHIYTLAPNSSTQSNFTHCFVAFNVEKLQGQTLDGGEDITVHLMDQKQVLVLLEKGDIVQALMAAPLWKYFVTYRKDLL